jgi:MFS family permease
MTETAAHLDSRRRWGVLAIVGAAFFMTILDVAIVNVALPSIERDLNVSETTVQWVLIAYAITFGGFLLLGGRMADLSGASGSSSSACSSSRSPRSSAASPATSAC